MLADVDGLDVKDDAAVDVDDADAGITRGRAERRQLHSDALALISKSSVTRRLIASRKTRADHG